MMVRSPIRGMLMAARSARPISRWISWVRPSIRPVRASLAVRVWVARGSIEYSAVTHPSPVPFLCGGGLSSQLAVHSTRVSPMLISAEPSA